MMPLWTAAWMALSLVSQSGPSTSPGGIEGTWQGDLKVTPQLSLRIVLKVAKGKDGALKATFDSPDQGASDLSVDTIGVDGDTVAFTAKNLGASYKGTFNKARTEIAGAWSQGGGSLPLTLKRTEATKTAKLAVPKELEGIWEGKLKVGAGLELRIVLRVEKGKDKEKDEALKATLESPDQGPGGMSVTAIGLEKDKLTFEVRSIGAKYEGKKSATGAEFTGTFTQSGAALPLTLTKTDKVSERKRPQLPKPPFPYRTTDVAYDNAAAKVRLAGTLTTPTGPGPFPAVLLITGSGAQDRDETIFGHKPFLVLADALTRRGIAVLRVDDRGVGRSTGDMTKTTSEDFAGDVEAGVAFLKARPEIAPARIGLVGHSEGGLIAPVVAARSKDVAFVVLLAGTGLSGEDILAMQGRLIARAGGAKEADVEKLAAFQKQVIGVVKSVADESAAAAKIDAIVKAAIDAMTEEQKKAVGDPGSFLQAQTRAIRSPWFRYFLTFDPRVALAKVRCPVLAINGEKDLQVPPKENLAEIRKALALAGNPDVTTRELPGLNHLFQHCKTGSPAEYASIEETFAPEALQLIGDWILDHTTAK